VTGPWDIHTHAHAHTHAHTHTHVHAHTHTHTHTLIHTHDLAAVDATDRSALALVVVACCTHISVLHAYSQ